jgi:glycosyltransferase involved in cell wall biosynthesis
MLLDMPKTAIVVPCYNEAARLNLEQFAAALSTYPWIYLYFVDDGSSDNTFNLLQQFTESNPERIKLLKLAKNSGKAAAVRHGMLAGVADGHALAGFWDADLATPFSELGRFIRCFADSNIQMVMGCRFRRLGSNIKRKQSRHYLGRVFATVASIMLQLPVYDTQCGAKIIRATTAVKLFSRPFISDWLFDVEVLKRMKDNIGAEACEREIMELPLNSWDDVGGSKLSVGKMLLAPLILIKIFLR